VIANVFRRNGWERRRWIAACAAGLALGFILVRPAATSGVAEIIVKLEPGVNISQITNHYPAYVVDGLPSRNVYVLAPAPGETAERLVDAIEDRTDLVVYAELSVAAQSPEGQPYSIWGHPAGQPGHAAGLPNAYLSQPALSQINAPMGALLSAPGSVVVAVLDTGIGFSHPALAGRLTADGYDFVDDDADASESPNGLDDDGDGQTDEMTGHGTFVAGLVTLVAPQARILPLRVLDSDGNGRAFILAEAIDYAVDHGAAVINLSLSTQAYSLALEQALKHANDSGVVVVAAAGNDASDQVVYPAGGYKVVSVSATDAENRKASFANYGSLVDFAAPGVSVLGPVPGGYAFWSGSSMAAPFVSGEAALLMSLTLGPDKADDVAVCLEKGAQKLDDSDPAYGGQLGKGQISVGASLQCYQEYAASHPDQ